MLLDISPLTPIQFPLLDKFYRAQRSPMRIGRAERAWVARSGGEVVAGVCLTPVAHGYWLTSLLVAPAHRDAGLATALLKRLRSQVHGPIWLFCHPDLQGFYERNGYGPCEQLPEALADRLASYRRHKRLIAMVNGGAVAYG